MKKKFNGVLKKIKEYIYKDDKIFAKGICFNKLLFIFVIGCIFGAYYEQILNLVLTYVKDGTIFWETRRGVIYGPLSPIYGAGFVIMVYYLANNKYKWYDILLRGALIGGIFEYLISFLQEKFIGTVSWDYSGYFLNINGRTTIPYMLFWGLLCLIMIKKVYPLFSKYIEKIPYNLGKLLSRFLVVFLVLDMTISWSALIRQDLRRIGIPPYTFIDSFFDEHYSDDDLKKYFPNMQPRRKNYGNN